MSSERMLSVPVGARLASYTHAHSVERNERDANQRSRRADENAPADVAPHVTGLLWGIVFSVPLWCLLGAGIWFVYAAL